MARWWIGLTLCALARTARATPAITPTERARTIVEAQLAVLGDPQALLATLSPDAVILGNGSFSLARGPNAIAIARTLTASPSGIAAAMPALSGIAADGTADAVWLDAEVTMVHAVHVTRTLVTRDVTTARLVELVVADGATWKIVALAFASTSGSRAPGDRLAAPAAAPLVALLGSPHELDRALQGDDTPAREAARQIIAPWRDRRAKVTGAVELHGTAWGFAAADLELAGDYATDAPPSHAALMVFAVPERGRWRMVALAR